MILLFAESAGTRRGLYVVGYTIPEGVDTMLDVIGVGWPNVDEDAYRDMADALREFADDADDDAYAAYQHIQKLLATGQSESLTALDRHWSKVQGKHKDLAKAGRLVAGALDRVADIIVARKIAAVAELAELCATIGISLAFAPVTAGLSTLLAGGKIAATRIAFKRILKEMAEMAVEEIVTTLTEPAVAAIENIVADLAIQTALNVAGVQDGYDSGQTAQAGKDGLQLNSAGGSALGPGTGMEIDHEAHGKARMHLAGVQVTMGDVTRGKLSKAKGHHGRAKGKDSLTAVLDTTIERVTEKLVKALDDLGDHVGKKVPAALAKSSKTHKNTDQDIRDSINKIDDKKGKDDGSDGRRKIDHGGRRAGRPGSRPQSTRETVDNPREKSIALNKRLCKTDPVDIASGEMVLPQTDLSLPGVLPLVVQRSHISGYRYGMCFGRSWASTLDERLELTGTNAVWAREDGSLLVYPTLPLHGAEDILPSEGDRIPLTHAGANALGNITYTTHDPLLGLTRRFTGHPYRSGGIYWLTEIEDRNGNTLHIGRNDEGFPTTLLHEGGYRVLVTTDPGIGRVSELALRTPDGPVEVAAYGYDSEGNLERVTNSSGAPLRFAYDANGRITSWTDRNGSTYQYVYDSAGRVVRTIGPDGFLSSAFTYTDGGQDGRITRFTDSTGATTVLRLNDLLQVVAETDPSGNTVIQNWDRYDRVLSRTDTRGHTTTWQWDDSGNLTSVTEPDGSVTTADYDTNGMPTVVRTPDGSVWRREYDDRGNNTALIAPDGTTTRYQHDAQGGIVAITDPMGAAETFRANGVGLPVTRTDALGNTYTFDRDAFGRPVTMTDPLGGVTRLEWSIEGQLLRRIEPDGTELTWNYDAEGNCLTEVHPDGGVTHSEYLQFGLLSARTDPGGARYEFTYDTELRLTHVRNSTGLTWRYEHDVLGRVVRETDFDGRTLTYTYDPAGRFLARTNPLGQTVTHRLDAAGRVTCKDVDGTVTSYTYDRAGNLVAARSPHSNLTMEYDAMGRLAAETVDGHTTRYTYDAIGRCTGRVTPGNVITTEDYDAAGNRIRMTVAGRPLNFAHDALGQEVGRTTGTTDGSLTFTTARDPLGRVREHSLAAQERTLRHRTYAYDGNHLKATTDRVTGHTRTYHSDASGRPLDIEEPGWRESYRYDSEGNQTEAEWPDRAPHPESRGLRSYDGTRLRTAGALSYTYDAAGRITERRKKRLSRKPDIWRYTWDAEDRLVSCTTPDGVLWTYTYDALSRRTAKRRHGTDGRIVEETRFAWDGSRLAEQTDSTTRTRLTWEYDGNRPLVQAEHRITAPQPRIAPDPEKRPDAGSAGSHTDARFFAIVTDLVGTPTDLVDDDGTITWQSRRAEWGSTAWTRTATAYTPLRFPGQYADPETGLHYNYFRHYDPEAGRYVTPDPLGLAPAANPAGYVHAPSTTADPMGLAPCMDTMLDLATKLNNVLPEGQARQKQVVAIIHAETPEGPTTFVSGTSKSKLTPAQVKLAKSMGLVPLPNDQYLKIPKGKKGGHAEQNILLFLDRMNRTTEGTWLPTHGAASNSVCKEFCHPVISSSKGAMFGLVYEKTHGTQQKQFYWPARHSPG
ncbi:RHS domain-containing protein [Streptomyces halstedii]|uniref:RHS domain-containing protein n=1 Tax=Streptomyces halstedii TaxID=1944 RepID=A0ABS6TV03_STRHA|nr:DUF6531 domain-containing protein [Streptomyces halstedii]MBV7672115.1 RHS domain-containing protein [Streptomyces halstedii]